MIGLIAGSGRLPVLFAQAASKAGHRVIAAAHEGETDPALQQHVARFAWVKLGQLNKILELLQGEGCAEAVLCGGITKVKLFDVRPDLLGLKVLTGLRSFGDDAALRAIAAAFEEKGLKIVSPLPLVPDLLAPRGPLGARSLGAEQRADAEAGLRAARRW
jgi:DUF1009 family protein